MRKVKYLLTALLLALVFLSACGSDSSDYDSGDTFNDSVKFLEEEIKQEKMFGDDKSDIMPN